MGRWVLLHWVDLLYWVNLLYWWGDIRGAADLLYWVDLLYWLGGICGAAGWALTGPTPFLLARSLLCVLQWWEATAHVGQALVPLGLHQVGSDGCTPGLEPFRGIWLRLSTMVRSGMG